MGLLKKGDQVALVACSNGLSKQMAERIEILKGTLREMGLEAICSSKLYAEEDGLRNGSPKEKAEVFNTLYAKDEIKAIFDVSGGDLANEVLPYLDYEGMVQLKKPVFGYSDLTTVINGIYAQTGEVTYLYQIRNIIGDEKSKRLFEESLLENKESLYTFNYEFLQGRFLEGVVVGGNIRCLLKLAGTPYLPDFKDKILFLESMSGNVAKMTTFLTQYEQMGVFEEVKGIILGSFTEMEREAYEPTIESLILERVPHLPIVKTSEIGHAVTSKALKIGEWIHLEV